jgi:hypothetical protein
MENKISITNAGYIDLSGKVIVSDPCYDRDVWCMAKNIAVKPGEYIACIVKSDESNLGIRVACIAVLNTESVKLLQPDSEWEVCSNHIGVDSGQCGIFDDTIYPMDKQSLGEHEDENTFYGECCKLTLSDAKSGILKSRRGVVSSSGFGDGVYNLLCLRRKGECVALMIDFDLAKKHTVMRALLNS